MRLFLAALLPALAFGKIIKLCFKRFTTFKCCSDHFLEQSFVNVDALNYSAPLPPVLVLLAIAAMHTVGQGVVVARHRQAHLCLLLLTHCCLIFVQLPARGTFHFSQVANQARAAASLQQGLIMAEVEFSSPLRRDEAQ